MHLQGIGLATVPYRRTAVGAEAAMTAVRLAFGALVGHNAERTEDEGE
jgi:hypothetical protein